MQYLFLLLVLTACTAPKTETKQDAAEISSSLEAFVPKTKEDLDKLRTPVPSYEVLNRLIPTESFGFLHYYTQDGKLTNNTAYSVIYLDPITYNYYYGQIIASNFSKDFPKLLDYSQITNYPLDHEHRFITVTNLSPSQKTVLDAGYFPQHTNLYVEILRKTVDDYVINQISLETNSKPQIIQHYAKIEIPNLQWLPRTNEYKQIYYVGATNGIPLDRLEELKSEYISPIEKIEMSTNMDGHIYITHSISNRVVFIFSNTGVYQYTDWRSKDQYGDLLGPVEEVY